MPKDKIGILTGGGDVPGLNPVIKSVVYRASELGRSVTGIRKGWEGLTHMDPSNPADPYIRPLNRDNTRAIDRTGGTVLHTSRTNPRKMTESKAPKHLSPDRLRLHSHRPRKSRSARHRLPHHHRRRRHPQLFRRPFRRGHARDRYPQDHGQ